MGAIRNLDGRVIFDYQGEVSYCPVPNVSTYSSLGRRPQERGWLRERLGDDFFNSVILVEFQGTNVTDAWLEHLKGLVHLRHLLLNGTQVADAGLEHLEGLSNRRAGT